DVRKKDRGIPHGMAAPWNGPPGPLRGMDSLAFRYHGPAPVRMFPPIGRSILELQCRFHRLKIPQINGSEVGLYAPGHEDVPKLDTAKASGGRIVMGISRNVDLP